MSEPATFETARTEEEIWKLPPLTPDQVRRLPVTFGLAYAGRAWDLSKARAYELVRQGQFPCRVAQLGPRGYRVLLVDLMQSLRMIDGETATPVTGIAAAGPAA